ncbi:ankyrin repeat-containing protein At5g02620-like [Neltuma alba]|uniref:ankyrin repeat-containing protein At5g02620-like n=1 Tax=Neltuma alba TaxID=207710 RepID=UPI0010A2C053|nr:ankyrin repeat-containing protein At5g02620-like [Prosopis alba]
MYEASYKGCAPTLKSLKEMENSNHHEEEKMIRVLYEAPHSGCVSTLRPLIRQHPLVLHVINSRTTFIDTPLHISASLGYLEFTRVLLAHKPKLALELDSFRSTALHIASAEGHIHIVKELLAVYEQTCLVPDQEGRIPLHVAVIRGRLEVVAEFIRAKPESLKILHNGRTVLHLCVTYNHLEILKALLDSSIEICDEMLNWRERDGNNTVLHLAIMLKQVEVVLPSPPSFWSCNYFCTTS